MTDFFAPPRRAAPVAIVGAGWLGRPLAEALAADGHPVRVSTTTPARADALTAAGLAPVVLRLEPDSAAAEWRPFLRGAAALVVSVPPATRGAPDPAAAYRLHTARLARLGALVADSGIRRVVLLSSTAVYPDAPGAPVLTEAAADAAHPLAVAEAALGAALPADVRYAVARLGGLMGPGRAPGRFFGVGRPVPQPAAPVNMLHLADAVGAVRALLPAPTATGAYTVCAARHPTRAEFYGAAAAALGLPPPTFAAAPGMVGKQLDSTRFRGATGYEFQFDDPLAALAEC